MDKKPTKKEIEQLQARIEHDQAKPIRENERRVRIGEKLEDAVKKMSHTSPVGNKDLAEWAKRQRKDYK